MKFWNGRVIYDGVKKFPWWNLIGKAEQQAALIIKEARQIVEEERDVIIRCAGVSAGEIRQEAGDEVLKQRAAVKLELQAAKLYPLTPQEYLNGLAVDADQLTFRACMTTLRALRERSIIPPMGATTTALHEHAGVINALNTALNYMESERKAAAKKVNDAANKTASVKT